MGACNNDIHIYFNCPFGFETTMSVHCLADVTSEMTSVNEPNHDALLTRKQNQYA